MAVPFAIANAGYAGAHINFQRLVVHVLCPKKGLYHIQRCSNASENFAIAAAGVVVAAAEIVEAQAPLEVALPCA